MKQYIEAAFRLKFRLILCALLVFLLTSAGLMLVKKGYTSSATVWAEQPLFYKDQSSLSNPYVSIAENQVNAFTELLSTRQFSLNIINKAGVPVNNTAADEDRAIAQLRQNLQLEAAGPHLIKITYTSNTPVGVQEVVTQSVKLFIDYMNTDRVRQANVALQLYRNQLSNYEQQMTKTSNDLNKYIQQNPGVMEAGAPSDTTLSSLQQQAFDARNRYNDLKNTITDIQAQSQASPDLSNQFFQLIDEPQQAKPYQLTSKDLIRNSLIALALALFTMVALMLVGTWTDPAVYTPNDVSLVLPEEYESSRDLLVVTMPYMGQLASIRRKAQTEARARASGQQEAARSPEANAAPKTI